MGLPQEVSRELAKAHSRSQKKLTSLKATIKLFQKGSVTSVID